MSRVRSLRFADIFRDGGSYEAWFSTPEDQRLVVYLEAHPGRSLGGIRHGRLFVYEGNEMPADAVPLPKGCEAERSLLRELTSFLAAPNFNPELREADYSRKRLTEMVAAIPNREDV